jgi:quinol monooxygenase YgiN
MIIEYLGISAAKGSRQQLAGTLASTLGPIQVQPGCLSCHLFQSAECPDEFLIAAKWASLEGLVGHLQSEVYKHLLLLMELGPSPPVVEFYTVQEAHGLELVHEARKSSE